MTLTADTITDAQILVLKADLLAEGHAGSEDVASCSYALPGSTRWEPIADWGESRPVQAADRLAARARCAELLNERRRLKLTANTITDAQIRALLAAHCTCRPIDADRTAHGHDCDDDVTEDCRVALGGYPNGQIGPRSTATAILQRQAARRICADRINARYAK